LGVQGEAEVAAIEMTTVTGILAAGVTTVVLGTGIAVEALTTDQRKALAQAHRMEATGVAATTAAATASTEAATMEMDSQTLVPTKEAPLEARTTFRPPSSLVVHRMAQAILPLSLPSPRHRLPNSHHHRP